MKYYNLFIHFENSFNTFQAISEILEKEPMKPEHTKFNSNLFDLWFYQVAINEDDDEPFDFINVFLDILEPNFDKLARLGIQRSDILIWLVYEYTGQCSMEFHPQEMKRLGESGIGFNIDCHKKEETNEE